MSAVAWRHTLELGDVFHNDDLTFEQKRAEIVRRIKEAPFYDPTDWDLDDVVTSLEENEDADEFDLTWDRFYDWCDSGKRVWVQTWPNSGGES